jgi:phosphatidylglycerol---prolipoprotein diacylglyceryl transferase
MHWYGLIIGIGMAVAISVAERVSKGKLPLWSGLWYMIVPGIVGARMYHAIDQWEYYMTNSNELILIQNGGLGIWGGIIGAILGLVVFAMIRAKRMEVKFAEEFFLLADIFALVAPLGQAIGRWGNYANDELWGVASGGSIWDKQPIFLYESVLNIILFGVLYMMYKRRVRGSTFGGYLVGYGLIRVMLEPLRQNNWVVGEMAVAAVVGVGMMILGGIILVRRERKVWD